MSAEAEKAARERRVFQESIDKSGLPISPQSVESRRPPEPDILCCHRDEGRIAFELAEICDSAIARKTRGRIRNEVEYVRGSDPSRRIVKDKLKKIYKTEHPIELLCYNAGSVISPDEQILEGIRRAIDKSKGQLQRIWLLGARCHLGARCYRVWPVSERGPHDRAE